MQETGLGTGCSSNNENCSRQPVGFPLNPCYLHSHVLSLLFTQFSKSNLLLPVLTPASDLEGDCTSHFTSVAALGLPTHHKLCRKTEE